MRKIPGIKKKPNGEYYLWLNRRYVYLGRTREAAEQTRIRIVAEMAAAQADPGIPGEPVSQRASLTVAYRTVPQHARRFENVCELPDHLRPPLLFIWNDAGVGVWSELVANGAGCDRAAWRCEPPVRQQADFARKNYLFVGGRIRTGAVRGGRCSTVCAVTGSWRDDGSGHRTD